MSRTSKQDDPGPLFNGRQAAERAGKNPKSFRTVARRLFPDEAPGYGGDWQLSLDQIDKIRRHMR